MKKKLMAVGALATCALSVFLCAQTANASTKDVVSNDKFVYNAKEGKNYNAQTTIANKNNVKLMTGNNYSGQNLKADLTYGDYTFTKGLYAKQTKVNSFGGWFSFFVSYLFDDQNLAQYYVSAKEGTTCGFYYTVCDKEPTNNSYSVSTDNTIKVIDEDTTGQFKVVETITEKLDKIYYSEFTFGNQGTLGIRSENQYVVLFGLTVVSSQEVTYRDNTNKAIENLINYYNTNGLSSSVVYEELLNEVKSSLNGVDHVSQIKNYDKYLEISEKYTELVKVENKINKLVDPNARRSQVYINYDAESKALLDDIASEIVVANNLGISNDEISNYPLYLEALDKYNELEANYNNTQEVISLINNLGEVEYTEEYKNQLATISSAYNNLLDQELVSNKDEFEAKLNAFNELSNSNVNAFVNKVNEANELKGEASSYVLINEANELYNTLIESDKNNDAVINALNTLKEVEASYNEFEETISETDYVCSYREDGSIKKVLLIGTINEFTSCSDIARIKMFVTNGQTGETTESIVPLVYTAIKFGGKYVKEKADGVRYVYVAITNTDGMYNGVEFSMKFEVEYIDGHVVSSDTITVGIR